MDPLSACGASCFGDEDGPVCWRVGFGITDEMDFAGHDRSGGRPEGLAGSEYSMKHSMM